MTTTILSILIVLFASISAYLIFNRGKKLSQDEASKSVKEYAEKNKVRIELNEEQMDQIINSFEKAPTEAARVTFFVDGKAKAEFNVAAYYYRGDTCCA